MVADPPKDKGSTNTVQARPAPKKAAIPKLSDSKKEKDRKAKGKTAQKGNGSSALR